MRWFVNGLLILMGVVIVKFIDGGFSPEESRETCIRLERAGVHLIELSGGTYESRAFHHKKESTK